MWPDGNFKGAFEPEFGFALAVKQCRRLRTLALGAAHQYPFSILDRAVSRILHQNSATVRVFTAPFQFLSVGTLLSLERCSQLSQFCFEDIGLEANQNKHVLSPIIAHLLTPAHFPHLTHLQLRAADANDDGTDERAVTESCVAEVLGRGTVVFDVVHGLIAQSSGCKP